MPYLFDIGNEHADRLFRFLARCANLLDSLDYGGIRRIRFTQGYGQVDTADKETVDPFDTGNVVNCVQRA